MDLQDFYDQLCKHDWFFDYSDDHNVWKQGRAERGVLNLIAKESPEHEALLQAFIARVLGSIHQNVKFACPPPPRKKDAREIAPSERIGPFGEMDPKSRA